ncbi:actin-related protein 6 isoform X2 [Condylostylus longicornis]|uniref:actin-related protein 6 isoform X2 n=1 Tax=Condylostylus longicornis TaxID=2530218 RepID=UPI00244E4103|nr:actin-related protein 6 isoform X2 [Condylostylus longicornis]
MGMFVFLIMEHILQRVMPNCVMKAKSERRRAFIGSQIEECRDASGLFYMLSFQKGYLVNYDVQKTVWDFMFSPDGVGINLAEKVLIVTEPQFNFESNQEAMTEIFFEEYEIEGIYRTTSANLSAMKYLSDIPNITTCIVIEMGYSFTHIVPFVKRKRIKEGIRRIDIGGKLLTNHLKELISYRHLNVMDESYVVNQIKEDICFVSQDFKRDLKLSKTRENPIVTEYVLPDFTSIKRGYVKKKDDNYKDYQMLKLSNERFTIPELLFYPSDIGIRQMGVAESVLDCLKACPPCSHHVLVSNIIVTGGCAFFPGMRDRLQGEIRKLIPDEFKVNVSIPEDPISYPWFGGKILAETPDFRENIMTREDYDENGVQHSVTKFDL